MLAENRCCKCDHVWSDKPIGFARYHQCPACGSAYWEWTNYTDPGDRHGSAARKSGSESASGQALRRRLRETWRKGTEQ